LQLLTAKPVTYLVNLSEKDYVRKKNKWLPKIKAWIDENNTGDPLIPFSVSLEERLAPLSPEDKEAEQKAAGATSALGKITQAGYSSLEVDFVLCLLFRISDHLFTAHPILYMWTGRGSRMDYPEGYQGTAGRWCDSVCRILRIWLDLIH
jgi:ribosome-binding ATPase YchF (GTP1/OBG family)